MPWRPIQHPFLFFVDVVFLLLGAGQGLVGVEGLVAERTVVVGGFGGTLGLWVGSVVGRWWVLDASDPVGVRLAGVVEGDACWVCEVAW